MRDSLHSFRRRVAAGEREDKRGAAAADDLEHEDNIRRNISLGDLMHDATVVPPRDPPDQAGLLGGAWERNSNELARSRRRG